jgi:hypothetical protein
MNCDELVLPSAEGVLATCKQFDEDNAITERTLQEVFRLYPTNDNETHVLLKVTALNRLYFGGIFDVHGMAAQIHQDVKIIDAALIQGAPGIVDKIARFLLHKTPDKFYAFATKYCSWHNPSAYPIWDGNVCRYLSCLKNTPFAKPDNWERYAQFVSFMAHFREYYNLDAFGFKDIDKFLWTHGAEPRKSANAGATSA